MNKIFGFLMSLLIYSSCFTQPIPEKPRILYGTCNKDSLTKVPFATWFNAGYNTYIPNAAVIAQLKKQNLNGINIDVFFGTWCGDSKREVPRLMKLLDTISFDSNHIHLMAVGGSDSLL